MHNILKSASFGELVELSDVYSDKAITKIQVARRSASDGPPRPAQQHLGIMHLMIREWIYHMCQGHRHFMAFLKVVLYSLTPACISLPAHQFTTWLQKKEASGSFVPTHAEYSPEQIQLARADVSCPGPVCQVFPLCVG